MELRTEVVLTLPRFGVCFDATGVGEPMEGEGLCVGLTLGGPAPGGRADTVREGAAGVNDGVLREEDWEEPPTAENGGGGAIGGK